RARTEDPPPSLLQRPYPVADRAAGRHLADARLAADPALAREDSPGDRRRGRDRAEGGPGLTGLARQYHQPGANLRGATYGLPLVFRVQRASVSAVGSADLAVGRPVDAAHDSGNATADAVLPRPRAAAGAPADDRPEVLPDDRHRRGRARRFPPHLLRDARELFVWPVLQGGRDRACLGVRVRAPEARRGAPLGQRLRGRPGARHTRRRDGVRPLGTDRPAARANRPPAGVGELLVGRRTGPL